MPTYVIEHPNKVATREHMEHVVASVGGLEVKGYEPGKLTVHAKKSAIESLEKKFPDWIIKKADCGSAPAASCPCNCPKP